MFEALKQSILQVTEPYADEARSLVADRTTEGRGYLDRICRHLDAIQAAVLLDRWHDAPKKFEFSFAELDSTQELDVVPSGTTWELEVASAVMLVGGATLILDVNGRFRGAYSVSVGGLTTNVDILRGLHLAPGDMLTVRTTGMAAGETMQGYLQFKARPIRAPYKHTSGQPTVMADRRNAPGQAEELERHSTPGIFLGPNPHGNGRDPHVPPALPRV